MAIELELKRHDPTAFKAGDRVLIRRKVQDVSGWDDTWTPEMDKYVGQVAIVESNTGTSGFRVRTDDKQTYRYPSTALEFDNTWKPDAVKGPKLIGVFRPRKKRVRVTAGPWDAAPCPHLRWHLMGFFREKIAIAKKPIMVNGESVTVEEVKVNCKKCDKFIILKAK